MWRTRNIVALFCFLLALPLIFSQARAGADPPVVAASHAVPAAHEDKAATSSSGQAVAKTLFGWHSDGPLTVATILLALATVALVLVTFMLYRITRVHAAHVDALVQIVARIHEANTRPMVGVALAKHGNGPIKLTFKSVGKGSARLNGAKLFVHRGTEVKENPISGCDDLWLVQGETFQVDDPESLISNLWSSRIEKLTVEWTFGGEGKAPDGLVNATDSWIVDSSAYTIRREGVASA